MEEKAKRGRPLKYKTPQEFKEKAYDVFLECEETGDIPTMKWLEYKMDCDFKDYEERKDFSPIVTRVRAISRAIFEQKALRREISEKLAGMYLAKNLPDSYKDTQNVEIKSESTVDVKGINNLLKEAMALEGVSREAYIATLKENLKEED